MLNTFAIGALVTVMMTVAASKASAATAETKDIVDTAVDAGSVNTRAKALTAADLIGTLKGPGKPENKAKLQRILTYHVVAGKMLAADVVKMHSAKAVSRDIIMIATYSGTVAVDNAKGVKTDIIASNGVIDVINTVILPKDKYAISWTLPFC